MMPGSTGTRRWFRHEVDLPVRMASASGIFNPPVQGRASELSEGGMAVYAGLNLSPQDLVDIEFDAPSHAHVTGIIRNRAGFRFGLEFLTPLPIDDRDAAAAELHSLAQVAPFTPAAARIFNKIRAANGDAAAYAVLAQALKVAGWPEAAQKASQQALAAFHRKRESYLRQKQVEIIRLQKEIELLRCFAAVLDDAQEQQEIDPQVCELIRNVPKLIPGR